MIFDTREKVKLFPTSLPEEPRVSTSKKPTIVPSIVPSVPYIPACNSLSQPSSKGWIEEIIEPSPDQEIEDLQLSQRPIQGPSEKAQPRRSERIHLQQEKNLPSGPVTRSQARKDTGEYSSVLISFPQEAYIDKMLSQFSLQDLKMHITPIDPNIHLSKDQCSSTDEEKVAMSKIPYISKNTWAWYELPY